MKKPLIGLTPQYDAENNRIWMRPQYTDSLLSSGGIPIILEQITAKNYISEICCQLDGILFTGGVDVNPYRYGEITSPECGTISDARDEFELALYNEAQNRNIPIFGICRGIQLINVAAGGTLIQHIPNHMNVTHEVRLVRDSMLYSIIGKETIITNSFHHQAVKNPAANMTACAWSDPEDSGIIEAICDESAEFFNLSVQWHPEYTYNEDENSKKLFDAFVSAASSYEAAKRSNR